MLKIFILLFSISVFAEPLKSTDHCSQTNGKKVLLIKQWHLPAGVNSTGDAKLPQQENQTAIYTQLRDWIAAKKVDAIVSEGCEGHIDAEFKPTFNGWNFTNLSAVKDEKRFEKIVTLVPLKLEVHFGPQLPVLCGDSSSEIRRGEMALSDLRGWAGFYERLAHATSDAQFNDYADTARKLLKIDPATPKDALLAALKTHMQGAISDFKDSLGKRNRSFLQTVQSSKATAVAVVIGGLHVAELKEDLQKAGLACEVFEPPGYDSQDEHVIEKLTSLIQ